MNEREKREKKKVGKLKRINKRFMIEKEKEKITKEK